MITKFREGMRVRKRKTRRKDKPLTGRQYNVWMCGKETSKDVNYRLETPNTVIRYVGSVLTDDGKRDIQKRKRVKSIEHLGDIDTPN